MSLTVRYLHSIDDDVKYDRTAPVDELPQGVQTAVYDMRTHQPRTTTTLPPAGSHYRRLFIYGDLTGFDNPYESDTLEFLLQPYRQGADRILIDHFEDLAS